MYKAIFFDLDCTLLPMDQDEFLDFYFKIVKEKFASLGFNPEEFHNGMWKSIGAVLKNDGKDTNENIFWNSFSKLVAEKSDVVKAEFESFYRNEFLEMKKLCGYNPKSAEIVKELKDSGYIVVLATNPFYPEIATLTRAGWSGVDISLFDYITTYSNSTSCKPSAHYYQNLCDKVGVKPEEVLMVGNDVDDDMPAKEAGLDVFLMTAQLINKNKKDISTYPQGGFDELMAYINR